MPTPLTAEVKTRLLVRGLSILCYEYLGEEHRLAVCRSGAGYYLGANDPQTGEPLARDSREYYPSAEAAQAAQAALDTGDWTQRDHP